MTDGVHQFNNISLGGRGGTNPGHQKIYSGGILWKKQGGGKSVEVDKADVAGITWMKVPRTNQLGVCLKDGSYDKFSGFRDQLVDEDFVVDKDDGGSPTDYSGEEDADASDSGDEKEKHGKRESKKDSSSTKASVSKKKFKSGEEDSSKKKKQK